MPRLSAPCLLGSGAALLVEGDRLLIHRLSDFPGERRPLRKPMCLVAVFQVADGTKGICEEVIGVLLFALPTACHCFYLRPPAYMDWISVSALVTARWTSSCLLSRDSGVSKDCSISAIVSIADMFFSCALRQTNMVSGT